MNIYIFRHIIARFGVSESLSCDFADVNSFGVKREEKQSSPSVKPRAIHRTTRHAIARRKIYMYKSRGGESSHMRSTSSSRDFGGGVIDGYLGDDRSGNQDECAGR